MHIAFENLLFSFYSVSCHFLLYKVSSSSFLGQLAMTFNLTLKSIFMVNHVFKVFIFTLISGITCDLLWRKKLKISKISYVLTGILQVFFEFILTLKSFFKVIQLFLKFTLKNIFWNLIKPKSVNDFECFIKNWVSQIIFFQESFMEFF